MHKDESGTYERLQHLQRTFLEPEIERHHGRIFKLIGDGLLADFSSVVDAVACAVAMQKGLTSAAGAQLPNAPIVMRMGVNLGDLIVDGEDRLGDGVNVAARLQHLAEPGGVCLSEEAYRQVRGKLPLTFEDAGEQRLKNIDDPVRVYRIRLITAGAWIQPVDRGGDKPSVAVLPFVNMSGDPEQEYFSDGITEDLITDLSRISGLFVVARNAVFAYKGRAVRTEELSHELGTRFILEGSVRKAGSRVRVNVQLIDGINGGHMWADRYDRDLTDIFAIQDEITKTIVKQLKIHLLPGERLGIQRGATRNVEAYNYYLRGRQFLHKHTKSQYQLARRMFEKAIEIDPSFSRAYSGVTDCDAFLFLQYHFPVSFNSILENCAKALALDDGLAEAHASRGLALYLTDQFDQAMIEFDRALAINPDLFEAYYFSARACFGHGLIDEAARRYEQAASLTADDYQSLILASCIYRSLGRHAECRALADEGVLRAEREMALHPDNQRAAYMGAIGLLALGETGRARDWASRALAIDPDDILTQYNLACFHALLGEADQAIDLVERFLPHTHAEAREWLRNDPDFLSLRDHPRWREIQRSICLPPPEARH